MAALFFQQKIILRLVADQKQDLFRQQGVGLRGPLEPASVLAAPLEVVLEDLAVQHEGDGDVAVLDLQPQVSEGGRLLFGAERCRETAVRLDHGVGDVPGVEDILAPPGPPSGRLWSAGGCAEHSGRSVHPE